jgi:hypothetical protein
VSHWLTLGNPSFFFLDLIMTITVNLKYSWSMKHGKSNATIRNFGEATGAVDFKDDELILTADKQVDSKSVKKMVTGLKKALIAQVFEIIKDDPVLKRDIAHVAWKIDVPKLSILSVEIA